MSEAPEGKLLLCCYNNTLYVHFIWEYFNTRKRIYL